MTDPLTVTLAVARPVLIKAGYSAIRKPLVRLRVVRGCVARAKKQQFAIRRWALYSWLRGSAASTVLDAPGVEGLPSTVLSLRPIVRGSDELDERTRILLDFILFEWIRAVEPSAAIALRGNLTDAHVTNEAEVTRKLIKEITSGSEAGRNFEKSLSGLHRWRAEEARRLAPNWQEAEIVVAQIADAAKPAVLLDQWHQHPPLWFEAAPADWVAWLAVVAHDHQATEATIAFCAVAIERGATDRGFLAALQAMAKSPIGSAEAKVHLSQFQESHPLCLAVMALFEERHTDARDALIPWNPDKPHQRAVRALVLAQALSKLGDDAAALSVLESVEGAEDSSGLAMTVAQYRLARAAGTSTINTIAEANRSLVLATRARDHRRQWRGPAAPCVVLAARAACLAGDVDRGWRLCREGPEGEATRDESQHPDVRSEAGLIAALSGRTAVALASLETIDSPFRVAEIRALLAADSDEPGEALGRWQEAFAAAEHDADRLVAARSIAERGGELPDLTAIGPGFEEKLREIKLLAAAMDETGDSRLEKLRAGASLAPVLAVQLAMEYRSAGEHQAAARVLQRAAETWPHASLWSMAAESYRRAGSWDEAIDCAERAISAGAGSWAGERQCRALKLEVFAASGALDRALEEARTLTASDPTDPSAQWAHIKCAVRRSLLDEAWTELTRTDPPAIPRDPGEVGLWVSLHVRMAPNGRYITQALDYASSFPDDAALRGGILAELYGRANAEVQCLTPDEVKSLHQATQAYTDQFPDSVHFRSVPIDPENPVETLAKLASNAPEVDPEFVEHVRTGAYPVGMLTLLASRTYLEVLIQCQGQVGIAHKERPRTSPGAGTTVRVLDTSAAVTLATLDESAREVLIGLSASLESSDEALRDCMMGAENFGPTRTMTVGWNSATNQPTVTEISETEAQAQARLARSVCDLIQRTRRVPWPELKSFAALDGDPMSFLLGVDVAATRLQELWVDDAALASVAREFGCTTVSTLEIINDALAAGRLTPVEHEQLLGQLVHAGYLQPPFNLASVRHGAELGGWRPTGASRFLSQPGAWEDAETASTFLLEVLAQVTAAGDMAHLQQWVFAGSLGLARASSLEVALSNQAILLGRILSQPWCDATRLLFVINACRQTVEETGVPDPVETVLRAHHKALLRRLDHATAGAMMFSYGSMLGTDDKSLIARIVLTAS